ncbi:hypothetical protein AB0J72_30785 [Dactylosporangium sp. NPDC049742]|uniref:DMP19 family protein n=1 Tax=Dactylosporangium sp. NPDC049742 TaxID=3154737 RepID=UPI00342ADC03
MFTTLGAQVWDDSLGLAMRMLTEGEDVALDQPVAMRHLAYVAWFDSRVEGSSLSQALEWHPAERMLKVAAGCDYFGLSGLAELIRELAADHENVERAMALDGEYRDRRGRDPEDNRIVDAIEERLRSAPQDFGLV